MTNNDTLAQKIHDQCVEAIKQQPLEEDFSEEELGIENLPDKGVVAVLRYWANKNNAGPDILWEQGYYKDLSKPTRKLFERIDELIDEATGKAIAKGLSEYHEFKK